MFPGNVEHQCVCLRVSACVCVHVCLCAWVCVSEFVCVCMWVCVLHLWVWLSVCVCSVKQTLLLFSNLVAIDAIDGCGFSNISFPAKPLHNVNYSISV